MSALQDPSFGVARDLLPHVHLVSTFRYTHKNQISPQEVTSLLMQAPKIARDTAPFYWTYLDRPENGSIYLTWQPLSQRHTEFSSDGYIWAPPEKYFHSDVGNGVTLEMYYHEAGYAAGEPFATHSRRRFRLMPPTAPNPNAPQVDPSLWIVHWGPTDGNNRVPVQMIPQDPRTRAVLETRQYLQRSGQIHRKEFILSDRVNWPHIPWPKPTDASRQQMYPANRGVPQTMAYPSHQPNAAGPPPKRHRANQSVHGQLPPPGASLPAETLYDDDEDTSRGDMFDHLTPREVSLARYCQNHEWMEELLASPYKISQIGFVDLGLGLKGELSGITEGIFEAQGAGAEKQALAKSAKTHLDADQSAEFKKRVTDRVESTKADIEKLKAEHAKKMARFKQNSLLTTAERELRNAVEEPGSDTLRLEGRTEDGEDGSSRWASKHSKTVNEIVSQVEAQLGRRAEVIHDLKRIQAGGYQEPTPPPVADALAPASATGGAQSGSAQGDNAMSRQPSHAGSQQSGFMGGDSDIDMGGTAAGLLDQMHTGASSTSTPQQHVSAVQSSAATPAHLNVPSPQPATQQGERANTDTDIKMDGAATNQPPTAPDQGTGSGDWVVVPKMGNAPETAANPASNSEPLKAPVSSSKQASAAGTPSAGFDQSDFNSLPDINTAGDAMAGFGGTPGALSEGLDINMEDSAFGDAFHGVDSQAGGDTPADTI
ncbi:DUF1750-domain-containing protein [Xylariaceae sp. FL0016]|nr:DUF1750-domain-containing protein [Xylariaceae sp. FL0016]